MAVKKLPGRSLGRLEDVPCLRLAVGLPLQPLGSVANFDRGQAGVSGRPVGGQTRPKARCTRLILLAMSGR